MNNRLARATLLMMFAAAPAAFADPQESSASAQPAKYENQALESCTYDLDHDRFGSYGSIDECVSDRADKLARDDANKSKLNQATVQKRHPN